MSQDVRNSKPTCSTCPFFFRPKGASLGDAGDCDFVRATPIALGQNQQGGLVTGTLRPRTTHDRTCNDHPRMAAWLARTYGAPRSGRLDPLPVDRDDDREAEPDIHAHDEPDAREREAAQEREREGGDPAESAVESPAKSLILRR